MNNKVANAVASFNRIIDARKEYERAMAYNARRVVRLSREEFAEYARETQAIQEREEI